MVSPRWWMRACVWLFATVLIVSGANRDSVQPQIGVVHLETSAKSLESCAFYYASGEIEIPSDLKAAVHYTLYEADQVNAGGNSTLDPTQPHALLFGGKRNMSVKIAINSNIISRSTRLLLFQTPTPNIYSVPPLSRTDLRNGIVLALIRPDEVNAIYDGFSVTKAALYSPQSSAFDLSLLVLMLIAEMCVAVGAQLSLARWNLSGDRAGSSSEKSSSSVVLSSLNLVVLGTSTCVVLILLYFFFKYLVYCVIAVFVLLAIVSQYVLLEQLVTTVCHQGLASTAHGQDSVTTFKVLLVRVPIIAVAMASSLYWVVWRNNPQIWLLHDYLGACVCISAISSLRISSYRLALCFMVFLLFYDVFFVYITPFFSAQGRSVMVEVATGAGSGERLPVVFEVPRLSFSRQHNCGYGSSLLGFGDVLIPGIFTSLMANFDVGLRDGRRIHFISALVSYGVGLLLTALALVFWSGQQPALLYIVPSLILGSVLTALCRKNFGQLWSGKEAVSDANCSLLHDEERE